MSEDRAFNAQVNCDARLRGTPSVLCQAAFELRHAELLSFAWSAWYFTRTYFAGSQYLRGLRARIEIIRVLASDRSSDSRSASGCDESMERLNDKDALKSAWIV